MPTVAEIAAVLERTESYLTSTLLPFWMDRSPDTAAGGFLTYFDREGKPTGQSDKTFLMQIRMLYTMASAHRAGYGGGRCEDLARWAADFVLDHYWDDRHEGWIWIADRNGTPTFSGKVGYGQCFAIYAFSEYFLATGDPRGREAAERTYSAVCRHMADSRHGGYHEIMRPDWRPERGGRFGGDRKSFDVHMHMMEALTTLYEMTGSETHRRRLLETIDLILTRMLHGEHGTGMMQFAPDFTPLEAIMFDVEWGSDEGPPDGVARPLDYTSYGHNVEFAWLLLHAADVLALPRSNYARVVERISRQCVRFGLDDQYGGVFIEGPADGPPTVMHKQFWQHAEVLVGMLDAFDLLDDVAYWDAFMNVHQFVFDKWINFAGGGEWYALLDRDGTPLWDYQGHAWKISYHTVRSMIQVCTRLSRRLER